MHGQNILYLATEFSSDCLMVLLQHCRKLFVGASRERSDKNPLHLAAANSSASAAKILVANGFKGFRSKDESENTPMHIACMKGI